MKKNLMTLALALLSLTASAVTYDFTDEVKFGESVEAQAKAEGLDEKVYTEAFDKYVDALTEKNKEALVKAIPEDKVGTAEADAFATKAVLDMLKADMGEKTLKEILALGAVKYDFSSTDNLEKSILAQAKAEGVPAEDAEELIAAYTVVLLAEKQAEVEALADDKVEAFILDILAKNMKSKTLVEIATELEKAIAE